MSEREDVYLSICLCDFTLVVLSGGCSNSSTVLLHLSPWTMTVGNAVSLSIFLLNQPVWSLGEGQAPEELDKPIETPPLSTLLIEKPQSATVSVGELTIKHTCGANRHGGRLACNQEKTFPLQSIPLWCSKKGRNLSPQTRTSRSSNSFRTQSTDFSVAESHLICI